MLSRPEGGVSFDAAIRSPSIAVKFCRLSVVYYCLLVVVLVISTRLHDVSAWSLVHSPNTYHHHVTSRRRHVPFPMRLSVDTDRGGSNEDQLRAEARRLLDQAKALREQARVLAETESRASQKDNISGSRIAGTVLPVSPELPWSLPSSSNCNDEEGLEYRLYVDIGREQGTWMDPRWAASGHRIEFTVDVRFDQSPTKASTPNDQRALEVLARDLLRQASATTTRSTPLTLTTAPYARLRGGFDRMKCEGGAYCLETSKGSGDGTIRFCIGVAGTADLQSRLGDVSIPDGALFFSLPAFRQKISLLSSKEGPVTVRQMGWNTGWWREESRIVGTFRAVPLESARQKDGF